MESESALNEFYRQQTAKAAENLKLEIQKLFKELIGSIESIEARSNPDYSVLIRLYEIEDLRIKVCNIAQKLEGECQ